MSFSPTSRRIIILLPQALQWFIQTPDLSLTQVFQTSPDGSASQTKHNTSSHWDPQIKKSCAPFMEVFAQRAKLLCGRLPLSYRICRKAWRTCYFLEIRVPMLAQLRIYLRLIYLEFKGLIFLNSYTVLYTCILGHIHILIYICKYVCNCYAHNSCMHNLYNYIEDTPYTI